LAKYYLVDQIKMNGMAGTYSTYEGQKCLTERGHLEDLSLDGRIILNWISKK
jgi:hypothetical protein